MEETVNTVIIGGGPAGVTTSYLLQQSQIAHVVLEKDRAFSEWYRRWDSFHMNTANWMNSLPGATDEFAAGASRDALGMKVDALCYFESYLAVVNPPIREYSEATSVRQAQHDTWYVVTPDSTYETANVVICTGTLRIPTIPFVASELPSTISQLHSSEYRNPEQIKTGHVLVVGSGTSGVQICEDLACFPSFPLLTGRKSDIWDCQWIQTPQFYGLLADNFRPDVDLIVLRFEGVTSLIKNNTPPLTGYYPVKILLYTSNY